MMTFLRLLTVASFAVCFCALSAQTVQFKVALLADGITYRVSVKPSVSWTPPNNNVLGAQVTLLAPTGGFQWTNLTNINGFWTSVPAVISPVENPGFDYFNVYLASSTAMPLTAGQETHLFTFQRQGTCTGAVELINNNTDPFMPPNSQSLNVGNYFATQGGGGSSNNLWVSNYDTGGAICASANCLVKYKLTQIGSTYKVSMIPMVTWQAPGNTTASMQVTIKTPTGGFQVGSLTNFIGGAQFAQTSYFPNLGGFGNDYFAFTLQNAGTTAITYQQGVEVDLFSFQNSGACGNGGNVFLMDNANDPNSNHPTANVGQQLTTFGYGTNDVPICLDANFSAPCTQPAPSCLMQYELLPLGNGVYQFSVIPNVNWNNGTDNITSSMQVSIKAPSGFQVGNLTNLTGAIFQLTSFYPDPPQDPGANDYFSFTLQNLGTNANTYNNGVKIPLFTFSNVGACAGGQVALVQNNDPFLPPNSNANVGQQMTTFGYGTNDVPICMASNFSAACSSDCLVEYKLTQLGNGLYQVSMIPRITWNNPNNITSSMQVTIRTATGGFQISNLNSLIPGAAFSLTSQYQNPPQATGWDYFSFNLVNAGTSAISYQNGVEVPLFTFQNGGACPGNFIYLIDGNDPFLPPNSNANVGQQLTTFGYGTNDVPICIFGNGSAPCSVPLPNCLINYNLEFVDCKYRVSMIPDTNWLGNDAITKKAKVTLRAPSGCFTPSNLTNFAFGANFVLVSTVVNPPDNPGYTYYCFNMTTVPTVAIPYQKGVPVPLFSFENSGTCCPLDSIRIMSSADPMAGGNSLNQNLDNHWETAGTGPAGVTPCLVGTAAQPCQSNQPVDLLGADKNICLGGSTLLTAPGGYLTYAWSPSTNLSCNNCQTPTASPSTTTTYFLTVTSSQGCVLTDSITVNVLTGPTINSVSSQNPITCGTNNGSITISATGSNLQYSINNGSTWQPGAVFSGLGAGSYTVLVRNSVTGCETDYTQNPVILTAPTAPVVSSVMTFNPNDCGVSNGSITIAATGSNLEYSINGGTTWQSSNVFQNLAAATYQVRVRNAISNCNTNNIPTTLTAPTPPTIMSVMALPTSDCGVTDGSISISASGVGSLQYSINGGSTWQSSNVFQNLAAGTYNIMVRNADGTCATPHSQPVVVSAPAQPTITNVSTTGTTSCSTNNGSLTISATGGVGQLEYSIDGINWQTNPTFSGLAAGNYTVLVRNQDNTCPNPYFGNPVVVASPAAPTITSVVPTAVSSCVSNNGSITVSATGSNPPYQYSLNGTTWQSSNVFQNLPAGTYNVWVRNAGGDCVAQFNQPVVVGAPQNPSIISVTPNNPTDCNISNGSIIISASGTGLQYSINNGTTWQSSNTFNGLGDGIYTVLVRNTPSMCTSSSQQVTLIAPTGPTLSNITASPTTDCDQNNGQIVISATGGQAPLEYSINGGVSWQTSHIFSNLPAGNYNVRVRNANGTCVVAASSVTVVESPNTPTLVSVTAASPSICGQNNGSISINATGGIPPLEYSIDGINWFTNPNFTGLGAGNYTVWVRNQDNTCPVAYPQNPVVLTAPASPSFVSVTPQNPSTCGVNNGSISVQATGGVAPYQYSLDGNNWQISNVFQNLAAGNYQIFVRNSDGTCPTQYNQTITLTAPTAPSVQSVTPTNPSDCSSNNGQIVVTATGSNLQYSINNGSTWQSGNVFQNLPAGNYVVVVRNSVTLCQSNAQNVALSNPAAPTITSATATPTNDCGAANGSITATATGGQPPLEYSLNNSTWQTSNVFQSLPAGNYTVWVRNFNGTCSNAYAQTVVVGAPAQPNIVSATPTHPTCGSNNGSITVQATGGMAPLEYSIDGVNWQTNNVFQNLAAGSYTVRVRNANGTCQSTFPNQVVLNVASQASIVSITPQNPTICGVNNGSITVQATGGIAPLEYSTDGVNWQTSNVFQNLAAGSYLVRVRNADGTCPVVASAPTVLTAPQSPVVQSVTPTNPTACGGTNGTISVSATGSNLQYSINGGTTWQTSNLFQNLPAGNYSVVVRNSVSSCSTTPQAVTLSAPASPVISSVSSNNVSDCNLSNGSITVTATSGQPPLEYSLDNVNYQTSNVFNALPAGNYNVFVRNFNGTCTVQHTSVVTIGAPAQPTITSVASTQPDCGVNNGSITVTATGGVAPLQYSINNGSTWQTSNVFQNLAAGSYTVLVQNANGTCSTPHAANPVVLNASNPPSIVSATPQHPTTCGVNNGSITVQATGGLPPLEYSIDGVNWQTNNIFQNLAAGSYVVRVRNANGTCVNQFANPVVLNAPTGVSIVQVLTSNPQGCGVNNGALQIIASGSNLLYSINGGITFQVSPYFTNLAAGTYQIVVTNSNNCTANTTATLTAPTAPSIPGLTPTPVSNCGMADGSVTISPTGGLPPYQYSINGGTTWQSSNTFTGLTAGSYVVWVRNSDGSCATPSSVFSIGTPQQPSILSVNATAPVSCANANGSVTIQATGGVAPLEYSIDGVNWQTSNVFNNLSSGSYTAFVRNANGTCSTPFAGNPLVLNAPPAPAITLVFAVQPTDCGQNNGSITISATGGTPPYEYSINGGTTWQLSHIFQNLGAGNYNVVVRNAGGQGCPSNYVLVQFQNQTQPTISNLTKTDPTGCGLSDGSITVTATGGSAPLQYSLDAVNWQFSNIFNGLSAGSYTVRVRNGNGTCQYIHPTPLVLNGQPSPVVNSVVATASACGQQTGSITVSASGGQAPLEYTIDGIFWQTNNVFQNLPAGTYTVFVRNFDNTCATAYALNPVVVGQSSGPSISNVFAVQPASCGQLGSITVTATGGTAPLQYSIDGGVNWQTSNVFNNLNGGNYIVMVRNADGSCASGNLPVTIISKPQPILLSVSTTNPTNCGSANGTLTIHAVGGQAPLEYSIDGVNWQTSNFFAGLSAGSFVPRVRNFDGTCAVTGTAVTLTQPTSLTIVSVTPTQPSGCGQNNGSISISATGGTGLQYSLNGFHWQTNTTFNNLPAGSYTVFVRKSDGTCQTTYAQNPVVLNATNNATIISVQHTQPDDCASPNGTITITATGAPVPLRYSIDGGATFQTSNYFSGLTGGAYVPVVSNADNTCSMTGAVVTLNFPVAPFIQGATPTAATDCGISPTGSISVSASGGLAPLQYSINNGATWQTSNVFQNLLPGYYTIKVRNANGKCEQTFGQLVQVQQPNSPTISSVNTTPATNCGTNNGIITVNAVGSNLQFSLNNSTWQTSNTFTNLAPGSYTVYVRSANSPNCVSNTPQPVSVSPAAAPTITKITVNPLSNCGTTDGSIVILATGGAGPLEYSVNGGVTFSNNNIFQNLPAGTYNIMVRNADDSCPVSGGSAVIPQLLAPTLVSVTPSNTTDCGIHNGSLTVNATGGVAPLQYSLDGNNWQNSPIFGNLPAGNYIVRVRNANGTCQTTAPVTTISQPANPTITNISTTQPTACGATNGSITVNASGGMAPLLYSVDGVNWQTNNVFQNLSSGTYTVFVRNADGTCAVPAASPTVLNPASGAPTIVQVNVQQPANCGQLGSITITASGGASPLQYSIDGGTTWQTNPVFQNLAAGSYDIVVRNVDGTCPTIYPPVNIQSKVAPVLQNVILIPPTDCIFDDAKIIILATSPNSQPIQYSIDSMTTWHSTNVFENLPPGNYYVFIRNADGTCAMANPDNPVVNCDFDLALRKTLSPGQSQAVRLGYDVWFTITVYNQGFMPATNIEVTDYLPPGTILSGHPNNSHWQKVAGANNLVKTIIPGVLQPDDSVKIQIALRIIHGAPGTAIINRAEISGATDENGSPVIDKDSQADDTNGNDNSVDDEIDDDGTLDEDDEDPADVVLVPGDPIGYIYCEKTGKIVSGGKIILTSAPPGGEILFAIPAPGDTLDGRTGYYQFITNGVQGTYTFGWQHPNGFPLSTLCLPQPNPAIPSALDGSLLDKDGLVNGVVDLGSGESGGQLNNFNCGFNNYFLSFTINVGDETILNHNNIPVQCGFIGSIVCQDSNGDGMPNPGEPTLDGVTVELYDCNNMSTPIATSVTNNGGKYKFDGLVAGSYKLKFIEPAGYQFALTSNGLPFNVNANGFTDCITLNFGECDTSKAVCMVACPQVTATASSLQVCPGESVQLFGTASSGTISWLPAPGLSCTNCQHPIATPSSTTSYIVQVTNGACLTRDTITITVLPRPNPQLIIVTPQNPINCGATNGAISVGTSETNVQYSINGGATWQSSGVFTGLPAGSYVVAVRFIGSQCFTMFPSNPVVLNDGNTPTINNVTITQPNNCTAPNGIINISASGANLQYSINNGTTWQLGNIFTGLGAGNYQILVRSSNDPNCTTSYPVVTLTLHQPIVSNVIVNANCNTGQNSLTIVATGGQAPLEYSIDGANWFTNNTFNNLPAGTYTVWVRNFNGTCATAWSQNPVGICVYDLALRKVLAQGQSSTVALGDTVNYLITVFNQGSEAVTDIQVVDYLPQGMLVVTSGWTQNFATNMTTTNIPGPLAGGASITISVATKLVFGGPGTMLKNVAEIKSFEDLTGNPQQDVDSTPDMNPNNDSEIDNVIDNSGGDEDDADPAEVMLDQFDPSGYIYCDKTGKILTGGTVFLVSGPAGGQIFYATDASGNLLDGRTGMYQIYTNGVAGVYTLGYTHPNGYPLSQKCLPHSGTFNPSGNDGNPIYDNDGTLNGIIHLGSGASGGYLNDYSCSKNLYYLRFYLDPQEQTLIAHNNIPVTCGVLGGRICLDQNNDGQPNPGEPGLPNITVQLIDCSNPASPQIIAATTTNAQGKYLFDGLKTGNYQVKIIPQAGFSVLGAAFNQHGESDCLNTTFMTCDTSLNACMSLCPTITNVFVVQPNCPPGNGGVIVISAHCLTSLQYSIDGGQTWQSSNIFSNLGPGVYTIVVSSGACTATWHVTVTLDCGTTPADGNLIGSTFEDCGDLDGIRDATETGLAGITVTLTGNGQNRTATTDAAGIFEIKNLPAGNYTLQFSKPAGLNFTIQNAGSDDSKDSDVNANGMVQVTVQSGQTLTNVAAGYKDIQPPVISFLHPSLIGKQTGDTVFLDCNNLQVFGLDDASAIDNLDKNVDLKFVEQPVQSFPTCSGGFLAVMHCAWVATDDCGNIAEIALVMAVRDQAPPQFVGVPANITLNVGDPIPAPAQVKVFDFCDPLTNTAQFSQTEVQNGCVTIITRRWTATDHCGNVATASHTITIGNGNFATPTITNTTPAGCGQNNGSASLAPTTYNYVWSDGGTGASRNNLAPGNYTVTATDASGCSGTVSVNIQQSSPLNITLASSAPATCSGGGANGQVSLAPATASFAWSDGGTGAVRNNLAAGNYIVSATDTNGCTGTRSITVDLSNDLTATVASVTADFCAQNNGTATLFPANLTYNWSDGGTGASRTGLSAGNYTVTATNGVAGCQTTLTVTIAAQNGINITVASKQNESCFGNDGIVTLSPATGVQYTWSDGGTGAVRTDLDADVYLVTGTDANGCVGMIMVEVMRDMHFLVGVTSSQPATCVGNDGQAVLFPNETGVQFAWSDGGTGAVRNNLTPGSYIVTVSTANCQEVIPVTIVLDCQNTGCTTPVFESNVITPARCGQPDGSAAVFVVGNEANFTYHWLPNNGISNAVGNSRSGLLPGNYLVEIKPLGFDSCALKVSLNVPNDTAGCAKPPTPTDFVQLPDGLKLFDCKKGSYQHCMPIRYNDFVAGYTVTNKGEQFNGKIKPCDVHEFSIYHVDLLTSTQTMGPFEVVEWRVGGTLHTGSFNNIQGLVDFMNQKDPAAQWKYDAVAMVVVAETPKSRYSNLQIRELNTSNIVILETTQLLDARGTTLEMPSGDYNLVVVHGPTGLKDTVQITVHCLTTDTIYQNMMVREYATILLDDSELLGPAQGMRIIQENIGGDAVQMLPEGKRMLKIYAAKTGTEQAILVLNDEKGVADTTVLIVRSNFLDVPADSVVVFNAISPNEDGSNDVWVILNLEKYPDNKVQVFNRWGERVFVKENYQNDWDARWEGKYLPDGTYFYFIEYDGGKRLTGYLQLHH